MVTLTEPLSRLAPEGHRVLFSGISWETYERLSMEIEQSGRKCKITYDSGEMEVEMPTRLHEMIIEFVREMLTDYCKAKGIAYMPTGATTWRRRLKEKGLEADASFYIQRMEEAEAAADENLDLCPPPDLAIETEVTLPLLPKLPVYAGIGIPELWHIKGDFTTRILRLDERERYQPIEQSTAIPFFTPAIIQHWLERRAKGKHFETLQQFRKEVLGLA